MAFTCTTCDTDSLFHPEYFSTLESAYNEVQTLPFGRVRGGEKVDRNGDGKAERPQLSNTVVCNFIRAV
eukprot:1394240-Amorphochlora_amoeboformis.AAC.2